MYQKVLIMLKLECYVLGNEVAKHIYESFGFVPNGDNYEDEITLVLKVK